MSESEWHTYMLKGMIAGLMQVFVTHQSMDAESVTKSAQTAELHERIQALETRVDMLADFMQALGSHACTHSGVAAQP